MGHYTPDEIDTLRDMVRAGNSNSEIAETLGRTEGAISVKLSHLGVTRRRRNKGRSWKHDDAVMMRMLREGYSTKDIAKALRRTPGAVFQRAKAFGGVKAIRAEFIESRAESMYEEIVSRTTRQHPTVFGTGKQRGLWQRLRDAWGALAA